MAIYIPPGRGGSSGSPNLSGSYVTTTGEAQTVFGEKTWGDVAVFVQDVTIEGEALLSDNIISLNNGEVADGVLAGEAGLLIDRGIGQDAFILFKESLIAKSKAVR